MTLETERLILRRWEESDIFVNVRAFGRSSTEMAEYLLREAKVALVPGSAFGTEGEGYLRVSYASSMEDLREACLRLRQALGKLSLKE